MPSIGLFARTSLPVLRKVLDLAALRQRVYATNVANAETPGYNRRDVKFADEMKNAGAGGLAPAATDAAHMGAAAQTEPSFEIVEDAPEGGGVDLELEMVSLAENQLRFHLAARLAAMRVAGLRASIRGRT